MTLTVVKVGGSLSQSPEKLRALCQKLSQLAEKHQLAVVPGGGMFADCVREADKRFSLSATAAHRMAILGMDQYGLLLADLIPNCEVVNSLEETKKTETRRLTLFLPSQFMFSNDNLPNSWTVTSDSIAAYIAGKLDAQKLVLVKDIDGIFSDDPKKNPNVKMLEHLTVKKFLELNGKTCVDAYLPILLENLKLECYIVNGLYPERVESVLIGQMTVGTVISP